MNKSIRTLLTFITLMAIPATLFAGSTATISWKYVNLREAPTEDAQVITELVKGVPVTLIEESGEWYKIESEQEIVGWVVQRSLSVTEPVTFKVAAPPSPAAETKQPEPGNAGLTYKEKNAQKKSYEEKEAAKSKTAATKAAPAETQEPATEGGGYLDAPPTEMPEFPSFTSTFLRMISSLFIILGLILLFYYVVKKYFSKSILSLEGASAITVLASKYIGQKSIIYVVDVMEKIIVVGIVGSEMKMLTEISDKAAMDRMRKDISSIKESEKPFKKFFSDRVKSSGAASYTGPKEESFDILDEVNERVEKKIDGLRDINDR